MDNEYIGTGNRDSYVNLGLAVLKMAVAEEGIGYLSTDDGRWWMEVLDMNPDDVVAAVHAHELRKAS